MLTETQERILKKRRLDYKDKKYMVKCRGCGRELLYSRSIEPCICGRDKLLSDTQKAHDFEDTSICRKCNFEKAEVQEYKIPCGSKIKILKGDFRNGGKNRLW